MLFGLSSYLVGVLTDILGKVSLPALPKGSKVKLPFNISAAPSIDREFLLYFSLLFLVTTVVLGSLVLGLITKGKEKHGVKYIVPLLILAIGLFFIVRLLINSLLGGAFTLA